MTTMPVHVRAQGFISTKPMAIELANPFKSGQTCLSSTEGEAKLHQTAGVDRLKKSSLYRVDFVVFVNFLVKAD